jgi:hypothetical protein
MMEARLDRLSPAGDTTAPAEVTCGGVKSVTTKTASAKLKEREQKCHPKGLAVYYVEYFTGFRFLMQSNGY